MCQTRELIWEKNHAIKLTWSYLLLFNLRLSLEFAQGAQQEAEHPFVPVNKKLYQM